MIPEFISACACFVYVSVVFPWVCCINAFVCFVYPWVWCIRSPGNQVGSPESKGLLPHQPHLSSFKFQTPLLGLCFYFFLGKWNCFGEKKQTFVEDLCNIKNQIMKTVHFQFLVLFPSLIKEYASQNLTVIISIKVWKVFTFLTISDSTC